MSWSYGLVEEIGENGYELKVCEIYFCGETHKRIFGVCAIDWKHLQENKKQVLQDLNSQAKAGVHIFYKNGKLRIRREKKR